MTYSKEWGFFLSYSIYFDHPSGLIKSVIEPGFIELPSNLSEPNDHICGPAIRKGFLCSECIDAFGPSAPSWSPRFTCMNCTNAFTRCGIIIYWYCQINLTSAPMVSFILYSQVVHNTINYGSIHPEDQMKTILSTISVFQGIWILNFFCYIISSFCISPKLQIIHILYLDGGRDMRSWASAPYFVIILRLVVWSIEGSYFLISVFCTCWSLSVAILQPYKRKFMVTWDTFLLANTAIMSAILAELLMTVVLLISTKINSF